LIKQLNDVIETINDRGDKINLALTIETRDQFYF